MKQAFFFLAVIVIASVARAAAPAPVVLFDGKSMNGWHQAGPGGFEIVDGCLVGSGGMGMLWNDHAFSDFVFHCQFKVSKAEDNSGVFVRFPDPGNDPWVAVNQGHEIQICDTEKNNQTGAIYNFQNCSELATKPVGQWNDYDIRVEGHHYLITLNGEQVNDFTTSRPLLRGYVGLQNHWGNVAFRDVVVTPIAGGATAVATTQPVTMMGAAPGLVGCYVDKVKSINAFRTSKAEPFFVRVDSQINFNIVSGDFYDSHLTEHFGVHWTGDIHIAEPGLYTFALQSDDGSRLTIGDQSVIDHSARHHSMDVKAGEMRFATAGDYPLRVDFVNDTSEAGCILSWQPPGVDHMATLPASALIHEKSAENISWDRGAWKLFSVDHRAWVKQHGSRPEKMDYGPFLSGTFDAPEPLGNTTLKGIIVSLGKDRATNVLFDTELLRYSAGWTGDLIDFRGVAYDGSHGVTPAIKGTQIFGSPVTPGWEHDGSWKDPRPHPYGSLPRDWGHYRGLYRNGDQVVFSYTVNGVGVLDLPGARLVDGKTLFTRTLLVDPSTHSLTLAIGDDHNLPAGAVLQLLDGVQVSVDSARHLAMATIPPHATAQQYAIPLGSALLEPRQRAAAVDFNALTHGGPRQWGEPLVTQGKLGPNDGPYTVDTITAPENNPFDSWLRFGGFDFFDGGKSAAICTWNGDVWIVKGIDATLSHLTWQRYATGLFQSLGVKVINGTVYVLGRDQITRLHDTNGDGEADFYENFNNDCEVSSGFHEFAHDLQVDSAGNIYFAKGGPVRSGGRGFSELTDDAGTILKVTPDGKSLSIYATGLRAPNGMSISPAGQMTVSDNQGTWTPACRISFVTPGAFLGVPSTSHKTPEPTNYGNPILWFPYVDGDYTTGDNSSGGAAWDIGDRWGPMDGKLIHLSYGTCSIFETMIENVDGIWQGGVVRFPVDFDSGIMRARFNAADGQLYVCGLKGWQTRAARDGIFQRVRYTGKPVYMPNELHVHAHDITIGFTCPLDKATATDGDNYDLQQWNYIWSDAYGSPEVSRDNVKKKGRDDVDVSAVTLSPDGKTITLHIADLKPVMQMKIQMKIKAADGSPVNWEIDNTLNKVPGLPSIATPQPGQIASENPWSASVNP